MNVEANRIETAVNWWQGKEERFKKAFSFGMETNTALMQEKLRYFEKVALRYNGTYDQDERIALRILKQERRSLEKQLFPNLFERMVRRLFIAPIVTEFALIRETALQQKDNRSLQERLQRSGLSDLSKEVDEKIRKGANQFTVLGSNYIQTHGRVNQEVNFSKNQNGNYQFDGLKVTIQNESNPNESKSQYFNPAECGQLSNDERANLVAGRAVLAGENWKQIDFNDKDAQGKFRYKEFPLSYGFDLGIALENFPIIELQNSFELFKLLNSLEQGNRRAITLEHEGKKELFFIEANPQMRELNIYDLNFKKTTWEKALGKKSVDLEKPAQQVKRSAVKKNGMSIK